MLNYNNFIVYRYNQYQTVIVEIEAPEHVLGIFFVTVLVHVVSPEHLELILVHQPVH